MSGNPGRVGMPAALWLQEFGSVVWSAFGEPPYHVGSSLATAHDDRPWRDVDVRLILSDEEYERQGFGDPRFPHQNGKWRALVMAFSALGERMTGLPIDFQIQQQTLANEQFEGMRSALGIVPLRIRESAAVEPDEALAAAEAAPAITWGPELEEAGLIPKRKPTPSEGTRIVGLAAAARALAAQIRKECEYSYDRRRGTPDRDWELEDPNGHALVVAVELSLEALHG